MPRLARPEERDAKQNAAVTPTHNDAGRLLAAEQLKGAERSETGVHSLI
jgi:hypothetical protein